MARARTIGNLEVEILVYACRCRCLAPTNSWALTSDDLDTQDEHSFLMMMTAVGPKAGPGQGTGAGSLGLRGQADCQCFKLGLNKYNVIQFIQVLEFFTASSPI